jgi:hypothetical protein
MRLRGSRFISTALAVLSLSGSRHAGAQACCAGTSAITPGRLGLHEDALVGLQVRAASLIGSYDQLGRYRPSQHETSELSFQQDMVAALRFFERAQCAVLIPIVQTRRSVAGRSEVGGGIGDVNLSLRYDVIDARRPVALPGVALLAGLTLPTGVPVESASNLLATDATGIGAIQINGGVALEQTFGAWTVGATGLAAKRLTRDVQNVQQTLGVEWTFIAAGAYTLESELALAAAVAYAIEGESTIDGIEQQGTSRRLLTATASALLPLSDPIRLRAAAFASPPSSSLGANQNALAGLSLMVIYAWL